EYLAQRGTPTHPTDLAEHDCLYLAETDKDHIWTFAKGRETHTVAVSGRYAVNQSQLRLTGVKNHLGIGIFHDFVVQDALTAGKVVQVLQEWNIKSNYHGSIAMQYAQTKSMPARLRVFIDFVLEHLSPKLNG
ncbi:LysR substrate-binding domain-containing protein, partial [Proteus terrae]|uniref:LysR substrate-binding domain-containing protein n=1 Tax=Proteus terrae TaxID=1574161 RepID=UPI00301D452A